MGKKFSTFMVSFSTMLIRTKLKIGKRKWNAGKKVKDKFERQSHPSYKSLSEIEI
jgi:hypothetical protein